MLYVAIALLAGSLMPTAAAGAGERRTRIHHFGGFNIKGTPAMPLRNVRHDLKVARKAASVLALQEFRWPWYWRAARSLMGRVREGVKRPAWRSSPGFDRGLGRPVFGAQAVMWRARLWKRLDTMSRLLHKGAAKISEDRYIRAVLLMDRLVTALKLAAWFGSTHFVVGADQDGDSAQRKRILEHDLQVFDEFLGDLVRTGWPVVFELDANIRPGGWAYPEFRRILKKHGAKLHGGVHGVEYLLTIDGRDVDVVVERATQVGTDRLRTDHEGRVIAFRLVAKPAKDAA